MKKPTLAILAIASAALLGSACSDDPKRPPVAIDDRAAPGGGGFGAGTRDAGEAGVDDAGDGGDAAACADLAATGAIIDQNAINDDPPAGTGGTIVDGTYDITDARLHQGAAGLPGPTGSSYQGSIRFAGTTFERIIVFRSSAGALAETRNSGTFTLNGQSATFTSSCPTPGQEQLTYSVANTSVTFSNLATKESFTFTLRP